MDLFVEKYRPQDLNGFVGDDTIRFKIQEYLKTGKLQNLLLCSRSTCNYSISKSCKFEK